MNYDLIAQLAVGGLVLGSAYALTSLSLGVIYSTTKIFHFAHAVVYTIAAYAAVLLTTELGLPLYVSIPAAICIATVSGLVIERLGYRPMRSSGASLMGLFLVSLGLTTIAPNALQLLFGPQNRSLGVDSPETYTLGSVTITSVDVITVIISAILIAGVLIFLSRSKQGVAVAATRVNPQMAAAVGISINKVYLLVFGIGSAMVACGSLLVLLNGVANPNMGLAPILTGLVAVFFGGVGSNLGSVVGGFVLGMLTSLSAIWLSSDFQTVVVFGILFVFIIARPQGLLGRRA